MLMIVSSHYAFYSGFDLSAESFTLSKMWVQFMKMGQYGNVLFVLISGYFLTDSKGVKPLKLINLWLRIVFYSVFIYVLFVIFGMTEFSFKELLTAFRPITKYHWWFASTYVVLYLIHEWLNVLIHNLSHKDYKRLLMLIGICWSIIPVLTNAQYNAAGIISFISVYIIAGYIKLWGSYSGSRKYIILSVVFLIVNYVCNMLISWAASKYPYFSGKIMYLYGMNRPFIVMSSICLFIGFKNLNVQYSRVINLIASATFGVYLIHENNFIRLFLWQEILSGANFQGSPYLIPYSIAAILTVYISCTVIELIRANVFKALSGGRLS